MQQPQIDYAPALLSHKRRRTARRITFGIIAAIAIVVAIKSGPSAWRHAEILYWQQRAMSYSPPADRIVYDDDPSDAAKLRVSNPSMTTGSNGELFDFAKPWDRLYQLMSPPGRKPSATLFMHEMQNPMGERRLLIVEFRFDEATFNYAVIAPGGLTRDPVEHLETVDSLEDLPRWHPVFPKTPRPRVSIVWYAGQADPRDQSHFTIRGVRDAKAFQVDGWLKVDGVELTESR